MLNYEFPPIGGGAANANLHILQQYAEKSGLRVDLLTSAPKGGFVTEKFSKNITIYKVGIHKKHLHFWRKVEIIEWLAKARPHYRRLLRQNDYDLAHAFSGFPTGWLCYRTASRLPYIISLRGSDVPGRHARLQFEYKILAPVFRAIWRNAATLVACSEGLKQRALSFMPAASIDVIPNGVELDRFCPARGDDKSETLRLLTVGRLSATKRIDVLIDAVEILHKEGRKLCFTIAGGGQSQQQLRARVSGRNLGGIVKIAGRVDPENMPQVYRDSDVFVSASVQEGMSNAMLEAMASGLPIITTRCEGVQELIVDNGIIVEDANADEIAAAIQRLDDDRQARREMASAARSRAEQFTWSTVAKKYLECYTLQGSKFPRSKP
ncbi:MAG: glycosyltransferase family 4 protein [Phycisphaerales bacterium]|nr:MAG: glycosyltransferase family 4 protein [Phycisphaerales bacterium]